jgi:hypothetical protein
MDWFNKRDDLIVLNSIRDAFSNEKFDGIEIWRLLGANITLNYWEAVNNKSLSFKLKQYKTFLYIFFCYDFLKLIKNYKKINYIKPKLKPVFIEVISIENRIKGFWKPLADLYDNENAILITDKIEIYQNLKNEYNTSLLLKFSFTDWCFTRIFLLGFIIRNFNKLFVKQKTYKPITPIQLLTTIALQLTLVTKLKWLVSKYNPKAFLTVWDWYNLGSAGCAVFKFNKLTSFTFIHGAAGKEALKEFLPLNANYIFAWGNHNKKSLVELGVFEPNILVCGCTRMKPYNFAKTESYQNKENLLILLTFLINECFLNDINDLIKNYSNNYNISIRLHPSSQIEKIAPKINCNEVIFIESKNETIESSILNSDIVVLDTSTAGFDAVNLLKPVFIIDSSPIPRPQDIMKDIIDAKAAVFCRSVSEFHTKLAKFKNDENYKKELMYNIANFNKQFIAFFDKEAAYKAKEFIEVLSK